MRVNRPFLLISVLLCSWAPLPGESGSSVRELTAIEEKFNHALLRSDWKTIEQMQGDDLIFTNSDGSVSDKATEVGSERAALAARSGSQGEFRLLFGPVDS